MNRGTYEPMKLNELELNEYKTLKKYAESFNNAVNNILHLSIAYNKNDKRITYFLNVKSLNDLNGIKYYYPIDKRNGDFKTIKKHILDYAEMIRTALLNRISVNEVANHE